MIFLMLSKGILIMDEYKIPGKCPVCGSTTHLARKRCDICSAKLSNNFPSRRFCSSNSQNLAFDKVDFLWYYYNNKN